MGGVGNLLTMECCVSSTGVSPNTSGMDMGGSNHNRGYDGGKPGKTDLRKQESQSSGGWISLEANLITPNQYLAQGVGINLNAPGIGTPFQDTSNL